MYCIHKHTKNMLSYLLFSKYPVVLVLIKLLTLIILILSNKVVAVLMLY